jgi:hypothetical protein
MKIIFASILICKTFLSFSQSSISIGPELAIPANFSKSTNIGFGGSLDFFYKTSSSFGPRVSVGYSRFKGKYLESDVVSFVPLRAGIQGVLADAIILYGEAGTAFYSAKRNGTKINNFTYALGAGYYVPLRTRQFLQISGSYNFFRFNEFLTYTWFNFRIAYGLNLGRPTKDPS